MALGRVMGYDLILRCENPKKSHITNRACVVLTRPDSAQPFHCTTWNTTVPSQICAQFHCAWISKVIVNLEKTKELEQAGRAQKRHKSVKHPRTSAGWWENQTWFTSTLFTSSLSCHSSRNNNSCNNSYNTNPTSQKPWLSHWIHLRTSCSTRYGRNLGKQIICSCKRWKCAALKMLGETGL